TQPEPWPGHPKSPERPQRLLKPQTVGWETDVARETICCLDAEVERDRPILPAGRVEQLCELGFLGAEAEGVADRAATKHVDEQGRGDVRLRPVSRAQRDRELQVAHPERTPTRKELLMLQ